MTVRHYTELRNAFKCRNCQTVRAYGFAFSPDLVDVELNCATCKEPTRHDYVGRKFFRVEMDCAVFGTDGDSKVRKITFTLDQVA